jgi:hypothetical protein
MFGVTVLAVVIIIGGVTWTLFGSNEPGAPSVPDNSQPDSQNPSDQTEPESPDTTPEPSENSSETPNGSLVSHQEQARDAAVEYIKSKHPTIAQFLTDLSWYGGRYEIEETENETYIYYASDWTVTVSWPPVENPTYQVSAHYASDQMEIVWEGSYQNGVVRETKFTGSRQQVSV